jgi:hypothetical protein
MQIEWQIFTADDPFTVIDSGSREGAEWEHPQDLAKAIVQDFFKRNRNVWEDWFGDDPWADIHLHLKSPPQVDAVFRTSVQWVPEAVCYKIPDPRPSQP